LTVFVMALLEYTVPSNQYWHCINELVTYKARLMRNISCNSAVSASLVLFQFLMPFYGFIEFFGYVC
jgi:hypothetical protein